MSDYKRLFNDFFEATGFNSADPKTIIIFGIWQELKRIAEMIRQGAN